ncbi:hypothetical protein KFK09_016860 [Dendrobium nobile]|uniref:Uncharacterized protein n=1 Tax=Dendrobium nobile TaxID=94219 RepID=A0A8T3B5V7_DENNO|nr:hypothetical protein KFK09_016860 [Dendrobium nobile]
MKKSSAPPGQERANRAAAGRNGQRVRGVFEERRNIFLEEVILRLQDFFFVFNNRRFILPIL